MSRPVMTRARRRFGLPWWGDLLLGGVLLVVSWTLWSVCGANPVVSAGVRKVSHWIGAVQSRLFGLIPIPLSEWVVGAAVLGPVLWLVLTLCRRRWRDLWPGLCRIVCLGSIGIFLFIFIYGVHHTAPALAEELDLPVGGYGQTRLEALVDHTIAQANRLAGQVPREGEDCAFGSFREMAKLVDQEYQRLSAQYSFFDRARPGLVKRSLVGGRIMSLVDLAGYYFPWTGESVVSSDVVQTHIPFDIAHETAHGLGVGPEDECNFCAFLACKDSGDPRLQYSAWLCAYVYASNSLYAIDRDAASRQASQLNEQVRHDLQVLSDSLRRFEGPLNDAGSAVNDALIKATGQPEGVASYGRVTDLLLAWYESQTPEE